MVINPSDWYEDYKGSFKEVLSPVPTIHSDYMLTAASIAKKKDIKNHFSKFLQEIIAYSLTEFLFYRRPAKTP